MNLWSRVITVLMFGAICFVLLVPTALRSGNTTLAIVVSVLFIIYAVANVVLWQRLRARR
jgi:membrane protein implicated in regulation of membrane protease activity